MIEERTSSGSRRTPSMAEVETVSRVVQLRNGKAEMIGI